MGNLVQGLVTEDALRQLFNSTMKAAFPEQQVPGMDPVVTVSMHSEGRYAFVELRTPEMASAALQLSGQVQLLGQSISVGRPSGYVDPSAAQMAAAQAATALSAFEVEVVCTNHISRQEVCWHSHVASAGSRCNLPSCRLSANLKDFVLNEEIRIHTQVDLIT